MIRAASPSITNLEKKFVMDALTNGWGANMSNYIDLFIKNFKKLCGKKYILTTANCTSAIHLALLSIGVKRGDEVIVPDLTWVASVSPITYLGAKPIFADVEKDSLCISVKSLKKNITKKTRAIIVVDLLGNMPEWEKILKLCKKKKIRIIEDAAEALGAKYKNKVAGSFGEISVFSFNATKLAMSGQGGCMCTNDKKLFLNAKLLSHHGMDKINQKKYYWSKIIGYQYNWSNIQAALAFAQIKRIKFLLSKKKQIFLNYKKILKKNPNFSINEKIKSVNQSYWISYLTFKGEKKIKKETIISLFNKKKIEIRPMFYPVSSMPAFKSYVNSKKIKKENNNSYDISKKSFCLPSGNSITLKDQTKVIMELTKIFDTI
jgi:perosamine synthetase